MTLVVEDGSKVTGANTYITLAEFKAWADARGVHYNSDAHVTRDILRAMDYIEELLFIGVKETRDQALQWPRVDVVIDGYALDVGEIPKELKNAAYELVKAIIDGDNKLNPVRRQIVREKVENGIDVTYKSNAGMQRHTPAVTRALRKLIRSPMEVTRA